jgi:hypothetical protein
LIRFANCNFFPYTLNDVVLKSGSNTIDFKVVPYIRVKDANITYNSATKIVTAKFKLEAGKPTVKLKELQLYAFSDMHVGDPVKFPIVGGGNIINRNPAIAIDPNVEYTLSIDVSKNLTTSVSDRFKFFLDGTYFFRVGALADVSGVGTVRRNYAPCVKLKLASQ